MAIIMVRIKVVLAIRDNSLELKVNCDPQGLAIIMVVRDNSLIITTRIIVAKIVATRIIKIVMAK